MKKSRLTGTLSISWILIPMLLVPQTLLSQERGTLYVPEKIKFKEGIHVREAIRNECKLEQRLADDIANTAQLVYTNVVRKRPESGSFDILEAQITEARGPGGGAFSGPKNIEIKGRMLSSSGRVKGSFRGERFSMGGPIKGLMGTCTIFKKISRVMAEDLTDWFRNPKQNYIFGEQ